MDYRYKQLEQELSALSRVFSELGTRLSEVAAEVTSPGVMPSEKVLEQISASRTSFESARTAVHTQAGAMLVSPLPRLGELLSIAAIDTLLKAAAAAEENKFSIEEERERALAILGRVLSITHKDDGEFKPLLECQAKTGELRGAISNVLWPHRHADSETIVSSKHSTNALLHFVENLDTLDDEKWMTLETTISETYGKPLFVAASRGKLVIRDLKPEPVAKPAATPPAPVPPKAPTPVAEVPKQAVAAEKPIEKKVVAEKPAPATPAAPAAAPSAPVVAASSPAVAPAAAVAEKKVAAPPAPVAPAIAATAAPLEKKEIVQEKVVPRPAAPSHAAAISVAPVVSTEKKELVEKAHPVAPPAVVIAPVVVAAQPAPMAAAPAATVSAPAAAVASTPAAVTPRPPTPVPAVAAVAPIHAAPATSAPAVIASIPVAAPVAAAGPAVVNSTHAAAPATVAQHASNSLTALATATEPAVERKSVGSVAIDIADKQRKEPRLAATASQTSPKAEPKAAEFSSEEDAQQSAGGDGSQRPQRWGFWRGNR